MSDLYAIESADSLPSPSLILFEDLIDRNIREMIRIAGSVDRLRPHCKTHKMPQIVRKLLDHGITRHKCATLAEAEMLAEAGAADVFLAYNIVGPNIDRVVAYRKRYPAVRFSVTADDPRPLASLSRRMAEEDLTIEVVMDLDTGLQRTGIAPGKTAVELYEMLSTLPGIEPGGLHWYDGQYRQTEIAERKSAVKGGRLALDQLRDKLLVNGFSIPRIVVGGTGSFPIHAEYSDPQMELSPGTVIFHDAGYGSIYPDLDFIPAAAVLTRVISCPTENRVTFDLGSKAIAADPPAGNRCLFYALPGAKEVLQNEEHLVLETGKPHNLQPGDAQLVFPWHICPTVALHQSATVFRGGKISDEWLVQARNRCLTI